MHLNALYFSIKIFIFLCISSIINFFLHIYFKKSDYNIFVFTKSWIRLAPSNSLLRIPLHYNRHTVNCDPLIVLLRLFYRWIPVEILGLIHVTNNIFFYICEIHSKEIWQFLSTPQNSTYKILSRVCLKISRFLYRYFLNP